MDIECVQIGAKIQVLSGQKEVGRGIIISALNNQERVVVETEKVVTEFGLVNRLTGEWVVLFEGLGGEICFSPKAPRYTFEMIWESKLLPAKWN